MRNRVNKIREKARWHEASIVVSIGFRCAHDLHIHTAIVSTRQSCLNISQPWCRIILSITKQLSKTSRDVIFALGNNLANSQQGTPLAARPARAGRAMLMGFRARGWLVMGRKPAYDINAWTGAIRGCFSKAGEWDRRQRHKYRGKVRL